MSQRDSRIFNQRYPLKKVNGSVHLTNTSLTYMTVSKYYVCKNISFENYGAINFCVKGNSITFEKDLIRMGHFKNRLCSNDERRIYCSISTELVDEYDRSGMLS